MYTLCQSVQLKVKFKVLKEFTKKPMLFSPVTVLRSPDKKSLAKEKDTTVVSFHSHCDQALIRGSDL